MDALRMRGRFIGNCLQLYSYFDPADMLRERRQFAAFARGHLLFDAASRYHVEVFSAVVEMETDDRPWADKLPGELHYWENSLGISKAPDWGVELERVKKTAQAVEEWVGQLPEAERNRLMLLMTSGYLLARADLMNTPLSPEQAVYALQERRAVLPQQPELRQRALPENGDTVELEPGETTYRFTLRPGPSMTPGKRIKTYALRARKRPMLGNQVAVKLEFCANGQVMRSLALKQGEVCCVNAVDGEIVSVLPSQALNGPNKIRRHGDALRLSDPEGERSLQYDGLVTSFAVGHLPGSCLTISQNRLNSEHYAFRQVYAELRSIGNLNLVEVMMAGDEYLLLQDTGTVHSSQQQWNGLQGIVSLAGLLGEGERQAYEG